jgi:DNA-binding HxlR family transcriptional regulator
VLELTPEEHAKYGCPIKLLQKATGGKWKLFILWLLREDKKRFGELRRILMPITQAQLTKALRELEQNGFVIRYVYQEVPPKVEYSLSDLGCSFVPILENMYSWGTQHLTGAFIEKIAD